MPRLTLALSWSMKPSFMELIIDSMSLDCWPELSKPSLAPITRTPVSEASSPSLSESIVLRLIRDKSSITNQVAPVSACRSTSILAIA